MEESFAAAFDQHQATIASLRRQSEALVQIADRLIQTVEAGRRIFVAGNGGSAADAQHIAAELVGRFKRNRRALPALALTTDTSILTAVSNDLSFEDVFARQIEALLGPGDCLWALSVSGTSPNIVKAVNAAKARGACVIAFTGRSGGALAGRADVCLCVDHTASDRVQEAHQLAYHLICERIESAFSPPASGGSVES